MDQSAEPHIVEETTEAPRATRPNLQSAGSLGSLEKGDASPGSALVSCPPTPSQRQQGVRGDIPLVWDELQESFSSWIMQEAIRQCEVARKAQTPETISQLVKLHSAQDEKDPCGLEPFVVSHPALDCAHVKELEISVNKGLEQDKKKAASMRQTVESLVEQAKALDMLGLDDSLKSERESEVARLAQASQRVGEIFSRDPTQRIGRQEVLLAECGPTAVEGMTEAQKNDVYRDIRNKRILERFKSAQAGAKALSNIDLIRERLLPSLDLRDEIASQEDHLAYFTTRKVAAATVKTEVETVVGDLESTLETAQERLRACRARKEDVSEDAHAKRLELQATLAQLKQLEMEYMDLHVEDEALRLTCDILEQDVMTTSHRLEMAQLAAGTASEACVKWDSSSAEHAESLQKLIQSEASLCRDRAIEPAKTAACNVELAIDLLSKAVAEKHTEFSAIVLREDDNVARCQELEVKMKSPDEDLDFVELETELARRQDETKANLKEMEACRTVIKELEESLVFAREEYVTLATNKCFGKIVEEDATRAMTEKITAASYVEHPIFVKVRPQFFFPPQVADQASASLEQKGTEFQWVDMPKPPAAEAEPAPPAAQAAASPPAAQGAFEAAG